ncbi:fungal-specific transcription factor domain-containing protein [Aspergillus cavernicola]|uniref:Fungal-specific transcription factor domain-containing protein n=1 Tax=Aspergillus cavernicola TaxID=176166 RepID=A0ABR4HNL0_9EURO
MPDHQSNSRSQRAGPACGNCHIRKVKCDLAVRGTPACTRCLESNLDCQPKPRARRHISRVISIPSTSSRAVANDRASGEIPSPGLAQNQQAPGEENDSPPQSPSSLPTQESLAEVTRTFGSLGLGDQPRALSVAGVNNISKQSSILVDFLSQDFSLGNINDYQVTFIDNYSTIARILAQEFGRGFTDDVYHHRDAPFIKRSQGGIPRSLTSAEQAVLELQGAFILPGQRIADSFIAAFFDRLHPLLPVIDRFEFMKNYYSIGTRNSDLSLLLLQSVLLSGSTVYRHPDLKLPTTEVSWKLYMRAKALIENRFEQDRLTLVQAHLLISTFACDSCDDTIQNMWLSVGAAVRIAQGLGMHRALGKANVRPSMCRRWKLTWWTLFIHDTLCSFEWGRPRAINLADSDVEPLSSVDFQPEEAGSLPSTEHTEMFIALCNLCHIISGWLDLLRPGVARQGTPESRISNIRCQVTLLAQWFESLPPVLAAATSLWSATLHIVYHAAMLRFTAMLPRQTELVYDAATQISRISEDLQQRNLLTSLWQFGIHEIDLAMGQQARRANSRSQSEREIGLNSLRSGLPVLRQLCDRSSVAVQGTEFYEHLIQRLERQTPQDEHGNWDFQGQGAISSNEGWAQEATPSYFFSNTGDWSYEVVGTDLMIFPDMEPQHFGHI